MDSGRVPKQKENFHELYFSECFFLIYKQQTNAKGMYYKNCHFIFFQR
jgi:hypothetical protein